MECKLNIAFPDNSQVAHDFYGNTPQPMIFVVAQGLAGRDDNALTGVDTHRVEVLHVANRHAIVEAVSNDFVLDFFPPCQIFLNQNLWTVSQSAADPLLQFFVIGAESRSQATKGISRAQHDRITNGVRRSNRILQTGCGDTPGYPNSDFSELADEEISILCLPNRLNRRAEHLNIVSFENTGLVQCEAAVQCGLTAKTEEDTIRFLLLNDLFHKIRTHGQEVDFVGQVVRGLDCRDVGINKNGPYTEVLQGLHSLASRVVEFAGFSNLEGPASKDQNLFESRRHEPSSESRRR